METSAISASFDPSRVRPSKRLTHLDSWRAIAVGLVILGHLANNARLVSWLSAHGVHGIFGYSRLGVLIFFFLSGLVVTRSCLAEGATFTARGFYIRRAFRILPPFTLYLLALIALRSSGLIQFDWREFIVSAFYLCNTSIAGPQGCSWFFGHTWSLAFEEQFYLVFAWVLLALLGRRPSIAALTLLTPLTALPLILPVEWIGAIGFVVTYALFILGALCAFFEEIVTKPIRSLALPALLIGAAICTFRPEIIHRSSALYQLAYLVGIPLLVLSSGQLPEILASMFKIRWIVYLGKISYSVYLFQQIFNAPIFSAMAPLVQLGMVVLMVAGCSVLYEYLERPCMTAAHRISDRLRGALADAQIPYSPGGQRSEDPLPASVPKLPI